MHQRPGGEAEGLLADLADLDGRGGRGETEELGGEVLGRAERAGDQPDDPPLAEGGVRVGAGGEDVRRAVGPAGAGQGAGREHGPGVEQLLVVVGAHADSSPSVVRPAYSPAAIRMPSDHATGPTSPTGSTLPSGPVQLSEPVSHSSYS